MNPFKIFRAVEKYYLLPQGAVCSRRRTKIWSEARAVAATLCRQYTQFSFPELGEFFERDHTALVYGVQRVKKDARLQEICKNIEEILAKKENVEL